ncbi:MAG: eukaryotic-like serine/threonine-protein kinase [Gammaproteobacteria bacterium]|jgi:tRNA A-37 threonylcarbamoyl transferase component Bud32|nr:eukaryotic-like serine/threonine-protein kinase [Gammaproteobacteria bacterium]
MSKLSASTVRREPAIAEAKRKAGRCLVVHDDLELRLRLAALVHRAVPTLDADCIGSAGFDALTPERIGAYAALFLIVEFGLRDQPADPLARLTRSREQAPRLPIFVFARGGDERNAARTIKLGANDYWPIHAVKIGELGEVLQRLAEPARSSGAAITTAADPRRQPQIAGYRLVKTLAESAAAAVYLARNDDLAQPVALKVQALKGPYEVSESDRQRFMRECQILSSLNHRSIADVLDFGVTDDYLYLALEYFPCGSLRDRLKNPVSEADAVNYARQIGEALQVLHAAHVVHRDLKPSNLMLTDDNRVILIDFGSASTWIAASDLSRSDLCTGTPYYVCPEQIDNRDPDGRGDLYSLGIVLYEMLVGALPYAGKNLIEIFMAHRAAPVPRLPQRVLRYQPIIDRLLAKEPADRYSSAALFLEDLSAVSAPIRTSVSGASHMGVPNS